MLKIKYYTLDKDERKKIKDEFYNTMFGKNIKFRLDRLFFTGLIGLMFSVFLLITNKNIWDLITGSTLFIASTVFIICSHKIRIKKINEYLVKKK